MNRPAFKSTCDLPFNNASIADSFRLLPALRQQDSETPGHWVIISGTNVVVTEGDNGPTLPFGELPPGLQPRRQPLCFGLWHGRPVRTFGIPSDAQLTPPWRIEAFNAAEDRLDPAGLSLAGVGKQILHWERQSRFCSRCGTATEALEGSWGKRCPSCAAEHFPHIHPCAIVLVRRGDQLLLTRKAEWTPGRYSLVAGFLDFGESLEECAVREVREETGIEIRDVRYVGSQNWPFPAQVMAGFVAEYAGGELSVDRTELEDARWFRISDLPTLPPRRSIARWIIDTFAM